MRVVAKSTLVKFWSRPGFADSKGALQSWYDEAIKASWKTPRDIKEQYRSASVCGNNRVVFKLKDVRLNAPVDAARFVRPAPVAPN